MGKKGSIFIVAMFSIFILLPQLGLFFEIDNEGVAFENRKLRDFPSITMEFFIEASIGEKINNYVWDHMPMRSVFLRADHWIDYHVFADSPVPEKVLLGKGRWLYLYPSVMIWPEKNNQSVKNFIDIAMRFKEIGKKNSVDYVFIISPSKASIYPEHLRDRNRLKFNRSFLEFQEKLQELEQNANNIVLLWKSFVEEKKRLLEIHKNVSSGVDGTQYLFRSRDRHFSWEAAIFQSKQIVERLVREDWKDSNLSNYFTGYELERSELEKRFLKINLPEPYQTFFGGKYMRDMGLEREVRSIGKGQANLVVYSAKGGNQIIPSEKKLLVIHDSFLAKSSFFIAPYFRESVFMHWSTLDDIKLFSEEAASADILVMQSVEGHLHFRLATIENILVELNKMVSLK